MKNLPSENVIVTGDFNINLLSSSCKSFEEIMFSNNLIPTISLATHEKPGCTPSLIDNILLNSTENLIASGVLQSRVSHHSPIFNIINSPTISKSDPTSKIPRYDFCETNLDKLRNEFSVKFSESMFDYRSEESFGNFVDIINGSIEGNCKVDDKLISKSKRNKLYNLWITNKQWKKLVPRIIN